MTDYISTPSTAFVGYSQVASGPLIDVALAIKSAEAENPDPVLVFDDSSGAVIELDLRGTTADIVTRMTEHGALEALVANTRNGSGIGLARPRGRPKLGVVAREVTLLPRHWEWLGRQSGGASQTLRRLVDIARRSDGGRTQTKIALEGTYRFLSALAGNLPDFENVTRALFSGDDAVFAARMAEWPTDVRAYALKLAKPSIESSLGNEDLY